ncbi:transposase [Streptomyces sp. NPDC054840]
MSNKHGKRYSEESKRDAVALARSSGRTATEVAPDLGMSPESLPTRGKQDKADGFRLPDGRGVRTGGTWATRAGGPQVASRARRRCERTARPCCEPSTTSTATSAPGRSSNPFGPRTAHTPAATDRMASRP